eukprot:CAMPEP_0116103570 /NCGR_PEP_ID=MMETSP0327-20121206/13955_1 /TAXON_ID=44447 /ORGANISM="Pseudo-nitzschia delicatissima, Strain B596" /LENGTH=894 /DNA_ID=CAMNT_0003595689 /DNA_START=83 /DNA_END=2767 /DNA_ORIENTATION=+
MGYADDGYLLPRSGRKSAQDGDNSSYRYDSINIASTKISIGEEDEEGSETEDPKAMQMLRVVPAALVLACWNIMLSVPFGSMFFSDDVPLATRTKEKLGMRMSMMALGVAQSIMGGWMSGFDTLTVWELAEVAPFYQKFASLAARSCHDDPSKIYPTTVFLISLSTMSIGFGYFVCGYFHIGKFLSFFPSYVTLGLIAGIGVWCVTVSMTVSASSHIFDDVEGGAKWWDYVMTFQFALSLALAMGIRPIRKIFPDFLFLDPLYFLSIPIVFHMVIAVLGIGFDEVVEAGFMFQEPSVDVEVDEPSVWEESLELWTLFDFSKVKWEVAFEASPRIFAATILGVMISTPFIPPLATLLEDENYSPDKEFIAHGVTNIISGLIVPGGVPACACYSSTVLYVNSGGGGRFCNFLLSCTSFISFVYGPMWAGYLPRCMAGAILIDMGIALTLEGVVDESHKHDPVEYMSIWVIMTVMTVFDMTSGLIAGLFMALFTSTYSSSSDNPVRRLCDAGPFPSSRHRKESEMATLEDPLTGRKKIVIFQLQGSLFFGNVAKIQDRLFDFLQKREMKKGIVIFDFTLVSSLDSSACVFFDSIQSTLQSDHGLAATVFVASPPKLALEKAKSKKMQSLSSDDDKYSSSQKHNKRTSLADETRFSVAYSERSTPREARKRRKRRSTMTTRGSYSRVFVHQDTFIHGTCFDYLDNALESCEDALLALAGGRPIVPPMMIMPQLSDFSSIDNDDPERAEALQMLKEYCVTDSLGVLKKIIDSMRRETFPKGAAIWNAGDRGHSAKLFLSGAVVAFVPKMCETDENWFRSSMETGSFLGLRSLVLDEHHLASACCEEESVFYSLDREAYDKLVQEAPEAARVLELSMARYLSHRLRHVSNRIYQAHSVPV